MRIAVASGKGGTGKTTVSVNLFHFFSKYTNSEVKLIDCDVEEPNTILFFRKPKIISSEKVYQKIPVINTETCNFCKKCAEWCTFNAITLVKSQRVALVHEEHCHSCGACLLTCSEKAITETLRVIGHITTYETERGKLLTEGRLEIGSSKQTLLVKELKKETSINNNIIIYDAPPGTSCPVVQTISGTDYVVLVTEPTPFGLHDLKIAVEVVKKLKIPFGVIINKSRPGYSGIYDFLNSNNIILLGEIPFSKSFSRKYAIGDILTAVPVKTEKIYMALIRKIISSI